MEGRNIDRWIVPDSRFSGQAGNSLSTFGAPLVTDGNGNLSGIILVPAGLPPVSNTRWTGNVDTLIMTRLVRRLDSLLAQRLLDSLLLRMMLTSLK